MTCSRAARSRSHGSMRGRWSRRRRAASTGRATRRRSGSTRARARSARRASGCNAWNRSDRTTRRATSRMPRRPRTPDEQTGSQPGLLLTRLRLASGRAINKNSAAIAETRFDDVMNKTAIGRYRKDLRAIAGAKVGVSVLPTTTTHHHYYPPPTAHRPPPTTTTATTTNTTNTTTNTTNTQHPTPNTQHPTPTTHTPPTTHQGSDSEKQRVHDVFNYGDMLFQACG